MSVRKRLKKLSVNRSTVIKERRCAVEDPSANTSTCFTLGTVVQ